MIQGCIKNNRAEGSTLTVAYPEEKLLLIKHFLCPSYEQTPLLGAKRYTKLTKYEYCS